MGYQECWALVKPQRYFGKLLKEYKATEDRGDYKNYTCLAKPVSILILKESFGKLPKGTKIIWTGGERAAQNVLGVFGDGISSLCKIDFIPVERVFEKAQDSRLYGISFNSKDMTQNRYMERYDPYQYAETIVGNMEITKKTMWNATMPINSSQENKKTVFLEKQANTEDDKDMEL